MTRSNEGRLVRAVARALACAALLAACAKSEPADPTQVSLDAGTPNGFDQCNATYFANYLKACTFAADCGGVLTCDLSKKFAQTPRCHVQLCESAADCRNAFQTLCTGDDFHYDCLRANPLVPTECRLVEGL